MNDKRTLRDDLIAAKALIATPETWWRGDTRSYGPGCECAATACQAATHTVTGERVFAMTRALEAAMPPSWTGYRSIIDFNDSPYTSHAEILATFDRAIAAAEVQS